MMRRRPLMRAAATTAVVAGTATRCQVGRPDANRPEPKPTRHRPNLNNRPPCRNAQEAPSPEASAPPSAGLAPEAMSRLEQLAALREQGILDPRKSSRRRRP